MFYQITRSGALGFPVRNAFLSYWPHVCIRLQNAYQVRWHFSGAECIILIYLCIYTYLYIRVLCTFLWLWIVSFCCDTFSLWSRLMIKWPGRRKVRSQQTWNQSVQRFPPENQDHQNLVNDCGSLKDFNANTWFWIWNALFTVLRWCKC